MLRELKKFKAQSISFLEYKKRNDCKIFHLSVKLIASDSALMKHLNPCIKAI